MTPLHDITIAFDAKRAVNNATGLGNYSRLVIRSVADTLPASRINLYAPAPDNAGRLADILARPNVALHTPRGHRPPSWWRSVSGMSAQATADGADIIHGLAGELPLDIARHSPASVVTIHDLIFRRVPADYSPVDRFIYDYKARKAVEAATRVIAISRRTRDDIVELYGADPSRIDVIYQGCDPAFSRPVSPGEIDRMRRELGIDGPYIAAVGTVEPRKNQMLAVKALAALPSDVSLVIVGRSRRGYLDSILDTARRSGVESRIITPGSVSFNLLPALYAGALFTSYTSRYEGFGLPVIEAINSGSPVIAATGSCLEEAGGPGALYVDPDDTDAFVDAARRLIDDSSLAPRMVAEGRAHTARFADDTMAAAILDTYSRAIAARG